MWGPLPHPPEGPLERSSPNARGDTAPGVPAPLFYPPVTDLHALIGRAFFPIGVLVALEDGAAGDDRRLAVGALCALAEVEVLKRHAIHVVGEGAARRIELGFADRLG